MKRTEETTATAIDNSWLDPERVMPADEETVLVHCPYGVSMGYYSRSSGMWNIYGYGTANIVDAWMPLPRFGGYAKRCEGE